MQKDFIKVKEKLKILLELSNNPNNHQGEPWIGG